MKNRYLIYASKACFSLAILGQSSIVAAAAREANPLTIGSQKQLFIDERFIGSSNSVRLVFNPPEVPVENLLPSDQVWERGGHSVYSSVLQDGNVYRMYYSTYPAGDATQYLCLAFSTDGVNWTKPDLGLIEFNGSKHNNIVGINISGTVFIDPFDEPTRRYKMWAITRKVDPGWAISVDWVERSQYLMQSADGARWERGAEPTMPFYLGAPEPVFWDDSIEKWVVYPRCYEPGEIRTYTRYTLGKHNLAASHSALELKLEATRKRSDPLPLDKFPIIFRPDKKDPIGTQIYTLGAEKYSYAQDVYVAFPSLWYSQRKWYGDQIDPNASNDLEMHFAVSRDGINWWRPFQAAIVPKGLPGSGRDGDVYVSGMVRHGDQLYVYYAGWSIQHHTARNPRTTAVGRAIFRLDGFASVDTPLEGGELITTPLIFEGNTLQLNALATGAGSIRVEILDAEGNPVPGRGMDDSMVVRGNSVRHTVRWKDGSDVSTWAGKPIRLRFVMRQSKLFAFQFLP